MPPTLWLLAVSFVLGTGVGAGVGGYLGRAPLLMQLAQERQVQAEHQRQQAEQQASVLLQAQRQGQALGQELAAQQRQLQQRKTESRYAVPQATTGRTCLDSAALRLLDSAPGLRIAAGHLSPASSDAVATDGAIATDTDMAYWAIDSAAQYETCRSRLDALVHWHEASDSGPAPP